MGDIDKLVVLGILTLWMIAMMASFPRAYELRLVARKARKLLGRGH